MSTVAVDPEFSRQAGLVLQALELDPERYFAMQDALEKANTLDDLSPRARQIWHQVVGAEKAPVTVKPYVRDGHPVAGYTRENGKVAGAVIEHLRGDANPFVNPKVDHREMNEDQRNITDEIINTWHGLKVGDLIASVESVDLDRWPSQKISMSGGIYHGEERVGSYARQFHIDHGQRYVAHDDMHIARSHQGAGFAGGFVAESEAMYRRLNMNEVRVAAVNVGSYAWARAGFRFKDPSGMQTVRSRLDDLEYLVQDGHVSKRDAQRFASMFPTYDQLDNVSALSDLPEGVFRSESEIAAYGRERPWTAQNGREMWLGKWMLLDNLWNGVKKLDDTTKAVTPEAMGAAYDAWLADKVKHGGTTMSGYGDDGNLYFEDDAQLWSRIEQATKSTVQVRPYTREGHLVHGYTREQEIADTLASLKQELGRPLQQPGVELQSAKLATTEGRTKAQVEAITRRLEGMKSGDEIEVSEGDLNLLNAGPEAAGRISDIAGVYRLVDGQWFKVTRRGKMTEAGIEWQDRLDPTNRTERDPRGHATLRTLTSEEFAQQYRGVLLRPLGIGNFQFTHPSMDQLTAWVDEQNPVGTTMVVNADGMKRWPLDTNVRKGIYLRKQDGWHHYESFDEMTPEGTEWTEDYSNAPPGTWLHGIPTRELVPLMEHRLVDLMHDEHSRKATDAEITAYAENVTANADPHDFARPGGSPGDAYRQQHRVLMQAGALIDTELQQALKDAGVPSKEEVTEAADAYNEANARMRAVLTKQHEMAEKIAFDVLTERLGALGLNTPREARGRTRWPGNTHSIHKDLVYHVDEYTLGESLEVFLNQASLAERDRGATFPPETQALMAAQRMRNSEWHDKLKEFKQEAAEIIDQRIAAEAERQNLIEPLAIAKDDAYAAGDRKDLIMALRKQRGPLALEVISRHRPMGGDLKITNPRRTKGIQSVIDAAKWLPTDWIAASNRVAPTVKTQTTKRAHYTSADGTIQTDAQAGTSLHELVHHMEYAIKPLGAAQWTFWHRRARGGNYDADVPPLKWIGAGKRSEVAVADEFKEVYSGKVYGQGSPTAHWEVLTMGIPSLFGIEYSPVAWDDDDYRKFVLGAMMLL